LKQKKADWKKLADDLLKRLKSFPKIKDDDFSSDYLRDRLTDWIITALENSGRVDEIIPLCQKEAVKTGSYARLVGLLMKAEQWGATEQWIFKGIKATDQKLPGIAVRLRTSLREMREKQGNWLQVAALRADDFFSAPSLKTYQLLEKASKKTNVWKKVKPVVFKYLETGKFSGTGSSWPLPATGVPETRRRQSQQFPLTETLIDIAIAEKRPDDVVRWHDKRKSQKTGWWLSEFKEDKIAGAIANRYPEEAMDIWKKLAANLIAQVKPKAYEKAAIYLGKIQRVLKKQKRGKDWVNYLARIRQEHVRKRKLLEILDSLDGKRILDTF
jgi:uncharacterized Zn finger protein